MNQMKHKTNTAPIKNGSYDDDDIPEIDLPGTDRADMDDDRPRKDGPGGE